MALLQLPPNKYYKRFFYSLIRTYPGQELCFTHYHGKLERTVRANLHKDNSSPGRDLLAVGGGVKFGWKSEYQII